MGSVAEQVLRSTRVPILVIRPDAVPIEATSVGAPAAKEIARV
jgi:hypothetical protein